MPKLKQKKKRGIPLDRCVANDAWAQVELYRWQHGELPPQDQSQCKDLVISKGLHKMADALGSPKPEDWPQFHALISVLRYTAEQLEGQEKLASARAAETEHYKKELVRITGSSSWEHARELVSNPPTPPS